MRAVLRVVCFGAANELNDIAGCRFDLLQADGFLPACCGAFDGFQWPGWYAVYRFADGLVLVVPVWLWRDRWISMACGTSCTC
jgi:hypothetical protein